MARVTVEDCIKKVPSRFELVLLAARRARQLMAGAPATIEADDKYPITALREIAEGAVDTNDLRKQAVHVYRKHIEMDDEEREMAALLSDDTESSEGGIEIGKSSIEQELDTSSVHVAEQSEAFKAEMSMDEALSTEDAGPIIPE